VFFRGVYVPDLFFYPGCVPIHGSFPRRSFFCNLGIYILPPSISCVVDQASSSLAWIGSPHRSFQSVPITRPLILEVFGCCPFLLFFSLFPSFCLVFFLPILFLSTPASPPRNFFLFSLSACSVTFASPFEDTLASRPTTVCALFLIPFSLFFGPPRVALLTPQWLVTHKDCVLFPKLYPPLGSCRLWNVCVLVASFFFLRLFFEFEGLLLSFPQGPHLSRLDCTLPRPHPSALSFRPTNEISQQPFPRFFVSPLSPSRPFVCQCFGHMCHPSMYCGSLFPWAPQFSGFLFFFISRPPAPSS